MPKYYTHLSNDHPEMIEVNLKLTRSIDMATSTVRTDRMVNGLNVDDVMGLVMAVQDDPDAGPPKLLTSLKEMSPAKLLVGGFGLSIIQVRFVALMLVGAAIIAESQLPAGQNVVAILALAFLMVWPLLIPVVIYLAMGERRGAAMQSIDSWLSRNARVINVVIFAAFGVVLLWQGLSGLFLG